MPALYSFLSANPLIDLTLELDDRFVDMAADGFDAVIRHGPVRDSWVVAKRLAPSQRYLVASPGYLAAQGAPASLADLDQRSAILYANREADWRFDGPDGSVVVRPKVGLRVNNGLIMRDAAVAGLGMTLLPSFLIHRELASGALQIIDIGAQAEAAEIYLAYAKDQGASAKVRALTEHLRKTFGSPPYWDAPAAPAKRSGRAVNS